MLPSHHHQSVVLECQPRFNFLDKVWPSALRSAATNGKFTISSITIEESLDQSPSDCLISRKQRIKLTEAFTPLIDCVPNGAEDFTRSVLTYHKNAIFQNNSMCRLGKYHDILYVALTIVYKYKVDDKLLVSHLLHAIFSCEKSFDRLVAPAILGPKVSHILSSWRPDLDTTIEAQDFLIYFVHHSTKLKMEFEDDNGTKYRLLDTPLLSLQGSPPLSVAVQTNDLAAVRFLLKFGATIGLECVLGSYQKLSSVASNSLPNCSCINKDLKNQKVLQKTKSLRYLLFPKLRTLRKTSSTTPGIHQWGDFCVHMRDGFILWPKDSLEISNLLINNSSLTLNNHILSNLHPRLFLDGIISTDVPSLKIMCRIVIRNSLNHCWNLPEGISHLNAPPVLQRYLHLEKED